MSLEDYEENDTRLLTSPRSIEACRLEGILPKDLIYIPKNKFHEPGVPKEVAEMRFEFNQNKRKELIGVATNARADLIKDLEAESNGSPEAPSKPHPQSASQRLTKTSKSMQSVLLGEAMSKDEETTQKQMDVIRRIKEKEQSRFEKYIANEERK